MKKKAIEVKKLTIVSRRHTITLASFRIIICVKFYKRTDALHTPKTASEQETRSCIRLGSGYRSRGEIFFSPYDCLVLCARNPCSMIKEDDRKPARCSFGLSSEAKAISRAGRYINHLWIPRITLPYHQSISVRRLSHSSESLIPILTERKLSDYINHHSHEVQQVASACFSPTRAFNIGTGPST